ncbi:hypothetical protein [Streptomyces luteocolor]|uniref:hypothetical protein n=1 Tax=Streptomyces luteocolor TaxID=285500 RepID=UPI000853AA33|nr:hypothetical protein [Streptomyces luteocolor]
MQPENTADGTDHPTRDLRTLIPEYETLARRTTVLNPEPATPDVSESSLGGKLLWPADEPWPSCAQDGHWTFGPDLRNRTEIVPGEVPMVPILQLFARDVPDVDFPEGKDVLQLTWCALIHDEDEDESPGPVVPRLYWRNEAEVRAGGLLTDPPEAGEGEYDEDNTPTPSTLSPTPALDYPSRWDLPQPLKDTWEPRFRNESGQTVWPPDGNVIGTKAGGWPAWIQPASWPTCANAHTMDHLLTITGDIQLGDCGGIYLFHCVTCPTHPWTWRSDGH